MNAIVISMGMLSKLYEILSSMKMTPEEYINLKVIKDNGYEHHSCEVVSKYDALTAIDMARNEKTNNAVGTQGWICPKCGRVYSPYTSRCTFCGNADDFKITCKL